MFDSSPQAATAAMTLRNLAHGFYLPNRRPSPTVTYCAQMNSALKNFTRFLSRPPELTDLDDGVMVQFVRFMREKRHRTPITTDCYLNHILTLWRFAAKRRMVEHWPEVKTLREMRLVQWDPRKLATLYRNLESLKGKIGNVPERLFWNAVIAVSWDLHEPFAAVRRLRWDDVNLFTRWTDFPARIPKKHGRKIPAFRIKLERTTCELLRELKEHSPADEPLIFGQRLSHSALYHRFNRFLHEWGLPSGQRNGISTLRKSSDLTGSYLEAVEAGKELQHVS